MKVQLNWLILMDMILAAKQGLQIKALMASTQMKKLILLFQFFLQKNQSLF